MQAINSALSASEEKNCASMTAKKPRFIRVGSLTRVLDLPHPENFSGIDYVVVSEMDCAPIIQILTIH